MRPDLAQIDAFTDKPFSGNPAGVCLLDRAPDEVWMQSLAAEMNLSETAFLFPPEHDSKPTATWQLRWFTPVVEVDLCGHATLAAAHHLFVHRKVEEPKLHFLTRSGTLTAERTTDGWIELDLPADEPALIEAPVGLIAALGLREEAIVAVARGRVAVLVEVADAEFVEKLAPDLAALCRLDVHGVIVTSVGSGLYDVVSRYFAPGVGIDEDPVTGAAHTTLGPYWAPKLAKEEMLAYQASRRGGTVRVRVAGDRVHLAGQATSIFRARLGAAALPPRPSTRRRPATPSAAVS